ncbi:invasion protein CiaB [Helicobacter sp. MIT 21-1697]|uniref:invasion protein CiaB n=1 Tax=Helicobacter sp. MIT 21-1697 TaxID=2993733 RepID=UPI00224AF665|nr:invasion protein CiaB [Helicobacter sp. MIT 21-1697]MCX2716742.1 invasion protein CiaB [Helicobacter sp. MIT 21-1697]
MSEKVTQDVARIYTMSKEINARLYEFFEAIQAQDKPHSSAHSPAIAEKYQLLCTLAKQCSLEPTMPTLMALAERIISLREDKIVQILKNQAKSQESHTTPSLETQQSQEQYVNSCRALLLDFVMEYYERIQSEFIESICKQKLLNAFYREILKSTHRIGLAMNEFFKIWQKQLIDGINRDLEHTYGFEEALTLLEHTLECDKEGQIAGRCYSVPQFLPDTHSFVSCAYAKAFPQEVAHILEALQISIERLEGLQDDIYNRKQAYIAYFKALYAAWAECDSTHLIERWQEVDSQWLHIDTPLQIAHPFEYYEDIYRHSVAPEWDLRLQSPQNTLPSHTKANIKAMFEMMSEQLNASGALKDNVRSALKQTTLYTALPVLVYGAENNGLFSAQVIPNDEYISRLKGKKIFAFPDRIIAQEQAKPQMKINAEFFPAAFLQEMRDVLFDKQTLWHYIYDISTNGHEFGHILWIERESEICMNVDGEFKNIEEFKATCGGLVAYFLHYEGKIAHTAHKDIALYESQLGGKEKILCALLNDTITRAVKLMAWRESIEVRAYYCEGLIHLSGMFESGVLSFNQSANPKLHIDTTQYKALMQWYQRTYASLAQHYLQKLPAKQWLKHFVDTKGYYPINSQVRAFVEHYWERYKLIGGEIL